MLRYRAAAAIGALAFTACAEGPTQTIGASAWATDALLAAGPGTPVFTDTYDVTEVVPCDGARRNGVLYAFAVGGAASTDCIIGGGGPGSTNNIDMPNIEGDAAGTLTLRFDVPTTVFGFGVAQSTASTPQEQSVIIELYRPGFGWLREEVRLTTDSDPLFAGGRYDYVGPAVRLASVRFSGPYTRFAFDNATYLRPPGR